LVAVATHLPWAISGFASGSPSLGISWSLGRPIFAALRFEDSAVAKKKHPWLASIHLPCEK